MRRNWITSLGLAKSHFIQVEYGVESCFDRTLEQINRGHDFEATREMISSTHERASGQGPPYFRVPGESGRKCFPKPGSFHRLPIDTIKFHQLQIVRGTAMEQLFQSQIRKCSSSSAWRSISGLSSDLWRGLNPDIVIERFSGEVPPRYLDHISWGLIRYDEVLG